MKNLLTLLTAAVLVALSACNSAKDTKNTNRESADATSAYDSVGSEASKLVKTAAIRFKVSDAARSGQQVSAVAKRLGGLVMHHTSESFVQESQTLQGSKDSALLVSSYTTTADMVVRIPAQHLEAFMDAVAGMAVFVNTRNMDIEDKTIDYLSARLKAGNREDLVTAQEKNNLTTKDAERLLQVKDDKTDKRIENARTDGAVKYSMVSLSFYQDAAISKEKMANTDLGNYRVPFAILLKNALTTGWYAFESVLIAITHVWAFLLAAALVWAGFKYRQKIKAEKAFPNLGI